MDSKVDLPDRNVEVLCNGLQVPDTGVEVSDSRTGIAGRQEVDWGIKPHCGGKGSELLC